MRTEPFWIDNDPGTGPHYQDIDPGHVPIVRVFQRYPPFALGAVAAFFVGERAQQNAERFAAVENMEAACLTVADELSEYLPDHEKPTFAQMQAWIHHLRAAVPDESEGAE